jgi:hypothetical protein
MIDMVNFKKSTLKLFEAVSILFLFGGLVSASSSALLSQCFPKVNLEPIPLMGDYNWTEKFNIKEGEIYLSPIYLDYGEAITCFYLSTVPVNFYVFDLNGLRYLSNPVSQAIAGMKVSYFGFASFTSLTPGYCWILIINPVRVYSASGEIAIYKYHAIPAITYNKEYTFCLKLTFLGIITSALAAAFYITVSKRGIRTSRLTQRC